MFFTVTIDAHKSNKLLLARSKTRVFILKTPRGIVVVNSYDYSILLFQASSQSSFPEMLPDLVVTQLLLLFYRQDIV